MNNGGLHLGGQERMLFISWGGNAQTNEVTRYKSEMQDDTMLGTNTGVAIFDSLPLTDTAVVRQCVNISRRKTASH